MQRDGLVCVRHVRADFLVEVEIIMSPETPLRESHDVGISLQHRIERMSEVERAYGHRARTHLRASR